MCVESLLIFLMEHTFVSQDWVMEAVRSENCLSYISLDLIKFYKSNRDFFGHVVGDLVVQNLSCATRDQSDI